MDGSETVKYFACGSNMLTKRLEDRIGPVEAVGWATIRSHAARFNKRGEDGSGKLGLFRTGDGRDFVIGVIFEIPADKLAELDRIEGVGHGCERQEVQVELGDEQIKVITYVATPDAFEEQLEPYNWYHGQVVIGAHEHNLPGMYIEMLHRALTKPDPVAERDQRERSLFK